MASPNVYGKRKLIENGNEEAEYISPSKRPHLDNPRTFNLLFRNPSKFIIAGPSQAGKTCFALQTLRWIPELFEDARCAQNVVYFYHQDQPAFRRFRKENIVHEWRNHLPTSEEIMQLASPFTKIGGSFVVIDDFGQKITLDTVELFTRISHHSNVVIMLLQQNLFSQINGFRDISLSSTYTVLYKNPRDSSQITALAKQIAPGNTRYVVDIFREATKKPHSYLLFDCHQKTPDYLRLRSNVLPHEGQPIVWMSKEQMADLRREEAVVEEENDYEDVEGRENELDADNNE